MSALAASAAGKAKEVAAVSGDIATVRNVAPSRRGVRVKRGNANYRPVATTLTIVFAMGFLKRWLVDKEAMPERSWWVNMAILGFVLSLMVEVSPRFGKDMSYLVLVAVIFAQSIPILDELEKQRVPPKPASPTGPPRVVSPLPGNRTRA